MRSLARFVLLMAGVTAVACKGNDAPPQVTPSGANLKTDTRVLEAGANVLQDVTPVKQIGVYINGFHVMRDQPTLHMEAHHYCNERNEEFSQCVIYDGNREDANLIGVEYIISERLFETLAPEERKMWHPHNYEILGGTLIGPGLPDVAEKAFMKKKLNSYGKTWHLWDTGHAGHKAAHSMPVGDALLAWSHNGDGEAPAGLVEERDKRMNVSTQKKREERADLAAMAHPQEGVDTLANALERTGQPAGVKNK